MTQEFTIAELAEKIGARFSGEGETKIKTINSLESAGTGEIAFVADAKFFEQAAKSLASCLIAPEAAEIEFSGALIFAKNPKLAFAKIAGLLHPDNRRTNWNQTANIAENSEVRASFIGAFVSVGGNTEIGENAVIFDGVKIGDNVKIGKRTVIHPNCVVYDNVSIGNDCVIHAGAILGADGFGYVRDQDKYVKFPQFGTVVIEDEVEIGANSCVDRAALRGETRIGKGTKIDNLVQIAHNVSIGERVVIAALTGISGSVVIEDDVVLAGQVGIADHVRIKKGAQIGAKSAVFPHKILRAGVWSGVPVQPIEDYKREHAMIKSLPRLREQVKELQRQIAELKAEKGK
jgi:UDP-3-O-[3-hydroxymyristoyl] glucosamine N-acyltransferase